jgi:FAD-dependent oxidoreductase domain-containing protein 1
MGTHRPQVVIIGGGIVGSFVAYFLKILGFDGDVVVIERDPSYQQSSTALSAASIRTQFGCSINLQMSLFGADVLRQSAELFGVGFDVGFTERGYLIVGPPELAVERRAAAQQQNLLGADIAAMDPQQLHAQFPWLRVDDLGVGTFGMRHEGWFDAWSLLRAVQSAARARDVRFHRATAIGIETNGARAVRVATDDATLDADWIVNAAGAWSAILMRPLGIDLPIEPRKRTVFRLRAPVATHNFPMLFDSSGAWIRPEGDGFIAGIAPPLLNDPDASGDFEADWGLLDEMLWPALAHRVPALESLRATAAWAGHYEYNTLDHNGVIGPHDEIPNLLFAAGFSGHGVMHSPATGRGIAEWIIHGAYRSLDLSPLGYARVRTRTPLSETVVY